MRGTAASIEQYLSDVIDLLERLGIALRDPDDVALLEDRDGGLSFEVSGRLPDGRDAARAEIIIREGFDPDDDEYVRARYEYELLDRERDFRRAFHLHSPDWFERHFLVVVHEHCERPIGLVRCKHYEGPPVRDAFAGVFGLLDAWTADPPDCGGLRCLE
jgi:hypothetical protein